jgi:hypothetical protein
MQDLFAMYDTLKDTVALFVEWWPMMLLSVPILVICIFLTSWLGPKFSWPVWAAAAGWISYKLGQKSEVDNQRKRSEDNRRKSEKASVKNGGRATNLKDLLERLGKRRS